MLIEWRFEHKAIRKDCAARGLMDPYVAFKSQYNSARQRGIEFLLTFDEWWSIWESVYHLRGTGTNGLCMGRTGDVGPYAVGNVYITTTLGNLRDYRGNKTQAEKDEIRAKKYAEKKHKPWGKEVKRLPQLIMQEKVYYEESLD